MSTFKVNQRVCKKFNRYRPSYGDERRFGEIVAENAKDKTFFVKWEAVWSHPPTEELREDQLLSEEDASALYTKLEEEFSEIESKVKEKIKAAAALLDEASALAGGDLSGMYDACRPLMSSLSASGWSTSSMSC